MLKRVDMTSCNLKTGINQKENMMIKRTIMSLFVLLPMLVFAGSAPSWDATNANYFVGKDTIIATSAFDTLTSATDSSDLITGWEPDDGWEYALVKGAITGTGSDSVKIQVNLDCYDVNGTLIGRYVQDSITAAAFEIMELPVRGGVIPGHSFDIVAKCYTAAGGQAILNYLSIIKRRLITIQKRGF